MKIILIAVPLAILALSGCASDHQGTKDAPHGPGDNSPAQVYNFPDGYGNLSSKCVGNGYRGWMSTHNKTDVPPVLRPDKSCPGYDGSQINGGDAVPAPNVSPK